MPYQTKNYQTPGGAETHIGGKLVFEGEGTVENLPAATTEKTGGVLLAAAQADSAASTIAALNTEFNALLAKLRAAGMMAPNE